MKIVYSKQFHFLFCPVGMVSSRKTKEKSISVENARPKLIGSAYTFTEGPAVDKVGNVFFTDQPNDQIFIWSATDNTVSVYMRPSGRSNGLFFDNSCQSRVEH